jgi:CheY-like chemotaxis protein
MADILFVTSDLMFSSRASSVAHRLGVSVSVTGNAAPPDAREVSTENNLTIENTVNIVNDDNAATRGPRLVVLDLSTPGLNVAQVVPQWRSLPNAPEIIAYAPHVHASKLESAKKAACDAVYTKGQFDTRLESLFARFQNKPE